MLAAPKRTTKSKAKPRKTTARAGGARASTRKAAKPASSRKKKPFGGYTVSFAGRRDTMEKVFGTKPIPPSQMTKKLWAYVKAKNLDNRQ